MPSVSQKSVTTTAVALVAATRERGSVEGRRFLIKTASAVVYIGPLGVTASNGYLLTANVEYPFTIDDDEAYYAITSSGTATVFVWGPE